MNTAEQLQQLLADYEESAETFAVAVRAMPDSREWPTPVVRLMEAVVHHMEVNNKIKLLAIQAIMAQRQSSPSPDVMKERARQLGIWLP